MKKYLIIIPILTLFLIQTNYLRNSLKKISNEQNDLNLAIREVNTKLNEDISSTKENMLNEIKYKSNINLPKLPTVAHAGGIFKEQPYTNSLDALESNKNKYEYFELDFSLTSDGHFVCSHGWSKHERNLVLGDDQEGAPTYADFLNLRNHHQWKACTLEEALNWAIVNNKKIVTDIKNQNINALSQLIKLNEKAKKVVIPQIYNKDEYDGVNALGFEKIIFTLYATNINEFDLKSWLNGKNIYAITTWHHRSPYITKIVNDAGIPVYVHTVNDEKMARFLNENYGIQGIYTDSLDNNLW